MNTTFKVGIIGGGVSGSVTAIQLAEHGITSVLFEKKQSLVNGPPFCHLHAGGNLYPDISDEQCRILMKQSIDMAKLFPQSIDERPTFISIPKTEKYEFTEIETRLKMLVEYYKELIIEDESNEILGKPEEYYKIYNKKELEALSNNASVKTPNTSDEWMTNAIQLIDIEKLKTPVILVQEYGWNLFRLGAQAQIAINKTNLCQLELNTQVTNIRDLRNSEETYNWEINTGKETFKVDYLVNSCGFKTGEIDEDLKINTERLIEFKAAYVSKWKPLPGLLPELIFHGERGTPNGMAQLTPYCEDYYQIHGMTEDITLFKNGLVQSEKNNPQPEFEEHINKKIETGWNQKETDIRTEKAIDFVSKFVPSFKTAIVGGPPLFGAQQIPGDDPTLRVGEVSFPSKLYARSEIVKASSALTVAHQIIGNFNNTEEITSNKNTLLKKISKEEINEVADNFAKQRGYPGALSRLIIDKD